MATTNDVRLPLHFAGHTALVTGARSGIGEAAASLLARAGLRVYAVDLQPPPEVPGILPFGADVSDPQQLDQLFEVLPDGVGYLLNCAGIVDSTGFSAVPDSSFERLHDVNLVGAYRTIDRARAAGELRSVVNITSIESSRVVALSDPDPNPAYATSKAALTMLTRVAARAAAADGVRVNAIAPGFVRTPMAQQHGESDEFPAALRSRVPLQRFAAPEEIAYAAAFLLSDEAAYITGSELIVDGGFCLT